MRHPILISLILCSAAALAADDPATQIPLIQTKPYNPVAGENRGWNEFTDSLKLGIFGNIYKATAMNVKQDILKKLSKSAAPTYFAPQELDQLAGRAAAKIEHEILAPGMSNTTARAAYLYGTNEIVGQVIQRVMEREGVAGKSRRELWAKRILGPFNDCMAKVRSYTETQGCLESFSADIQKNIGLAMTHELARQELGGPYVKGRAEEYTRCLRPNSLGADDRVKDCVFRAMRTGILALSRASVLENGRELGDKTAKAVLARVFPAYEQCLQNAKERAAIAVCVDSLTIRASKEITRETVLGNQGIRDAFPKPEDRARVAAAASDEFAACLRRNIAENRRDKSGQLVTKNCEESVTKSTAKVGVLKIFHTSIEQNHGGSIEERKKLYAEAEARLNACWGADPQSCLRNGTIQLARGIAAARLARDIPQALLKKEPGFTDQLLGTIEGCLKKELPADLMKAPAVSAKIDGCTGRLLRTAALRVAEFQLGEILGDKLSAKETRQLIDSLVTRGFSACLGETPDALKVDECSIELRRASGIEVAKKLFPKEFDKFVQEKGGLEAFGMSKESRDGFLKSLLGKHESCLSRGISRENAVNSEAALDACFKTSIRELVLFLGDKEFRKNVGKHVSDKKEADGFAARFGRDFSACLAEKQGASFSIDEYIANVTACGNRLTHSNTRELGKRQVAAAIRQHVQGNAPASVAERERLSRELLGRFDACMDKLPHAEANGNDPCTRDLEVNATRDIVITSGRLLAKAQLGAKEPPKALKETEDRFKACLVGLKKTESTDACVKAYVLEGAKVIGGIKFRQALSGAMGAREFDAAKDRLRGIEDAFMACLDSIPNKTVDDKLMAAVEVCSTRLQEDAIAFLQARIEGWMAKEDDDAEVKRVKAEIALAMPCFDAVVPSAPYEEAGVQAADPDGLLKELAKVIGEYIAYDAKRAGNDLNAVFAQLAKDLEAAGSLEARRNLVQMLARQGVLDQLLKSFIRAEVRDALSTLPADQRLPKDAEGKLLEPATFDKVFAGENMERLRPILAKTILEPLLVDGKSLKAPELVAAQKVLKRDVANALLKHPEFGQMLLDSFVQQGIDRTGGFERFFGELWYGRKAFRWSHLKTTTHGIAAETYIREQILKPKFLGEELSAEELKRRLDRANELVRTAVKNT